MKKNKLLKILITGIISLGLIGCESAKEDDKTITIGVSPVPHAEIVKQIEPVLKEEGYNLVIKEFDDYETPNTAVQDGEIDANYFQHIAYLNTTNSEKGYDLTYTAEIHIEPMAIYSTKLSTFTRSWFN